MPEKETPGPAPTPAPRPAPHPAPEAGTESEKPIDETIPGGRYQVGDRMVDAHGNEIRKKG